MERLIISTKDGSHTISIPSMEVTYHSHHGAIQESMHVFIRAGMDEWIRQHPGQQPLHILEMGLGTGLNALLTAMEAAKYRLPIHYTALELYPLSVEQASTLNYCSQLDQHAWQPVFEQLHTCSWEEDQVLTPYFTLHKTKTDLVFYSTNQSRMPSGLRFAPLINLVYFDAFAPSAQPELWTKEVFEKLYGLLRPGGLLVTYCSKGDVRRAMQAAGFAIEKIPGPPGKREMVRAMRG